MTKVKDINPISNIPRPVGGTDLGIPFRAWDPVGLCFGDSFGKNRGQLLPQVGGDDWRSPVIAWTKPIPNGEPIEVTSAVKGGAQLWDYPHDNAEFSTVLPTDCIVLGDDLYAWVMVTKGLGNERWCELAKSSDRGATWDTGPKWSTSAFRGMRVMLTFDRKPGSDWIDIFSTGGLARNKGMLRWRVRAADFRDQSKWEGWCFKDGAWKWVVNPKDDEPSEILPGWKFMEIGFRWIQGNAVLSGGDAGDYSAFVKVGANTDADWTKAKTYRPVTGLPRGVDTVSRLYGCYVHPDSKLDTGHGEVFTMIVSTWAESGNPYRAQQHKFGGVLAVGPIDNTVVVPPVVAPPTPPVVTPDPPKEPEVPTPEDVTRVAGVGETTTDFDLGRPSGKPGPLNLWGAVKRVLFEVTLWQGHRSEKDLRGNAASVDTLYGNSVQAASWGRLNADRLDKILRNQAKIGAALKITDLEK